METTVVNGMAYGPVLTVTVGASPFVFINPESVPVMVMISAHVSSAIELSVDNTESWTDTGLSQGSFRLNPRQALRVTYNGQSPVINYTPN